MTTLRKRLEKSGIDCPAVWECPGFKTSDRLLSPGPEDNLSPRHRFIYNFYKVGKHGRDVR